MNYKTPFYFVMWMLTRVWSRVSAMPKRWHCAISEMYKESTGMFLFGWACITTCGSAVISLVALFSTAEGAAFGLTLKTCMSISLCYLIFVVLSDQYQQFDAERQGTWQRLRD